MQPSKLQEIYDHQTKSKLPVDFEVVGKPNVFVSFSGIESGSYVNSQLGRMSAEEYTEIV